MSHHVHFPAFETSQSRAMRCIGLGALWLAAACAEPTTSESTDLASSHLPILNGTGADSATNERGGFVALSMPAPDIDAVFCSGTLYTNRALITAKHCLSHAQTAHIKARPNELLVSMGRGGLAPQYRNGGAIWFHRTKDLAIVEVSTPFEMHRTSDNVLATDGYQRPVTSVPAGSPVLCYGYGRTAETCDTNGNNCTGPGAGLLRSAALTAQIINDPVNKIQFFRYEPNTQRQLQAHGDSGGGCVTFNRVPVALWHQPLVSINTNCFPGEFCNAEAATEINVEGVWERVSP
jgi:hypothetical protein